MNVNCGEQEVLYLDKKLFFFSDWTHMFSLLSHFLMPYTHTLIFIFSFVSKDLIAVLLPRVLPAITDGLQDLDDDVRAVAAAALIPVVRGLVQLLPNKV